MSVAQPFLAEINECDYLFLEDIAELTGNGLRLIAREGRASKVPVAIEIAGTQLGEGRPVRSDSTCSVFEISWKSYVAYQVRNETYVGADASDEESTGKLMRLYSKSHFLEYISRETSARDGYPGPLAHFCLICSDHVIDVVAGEDPQVRKVGPRDVVH